MNDVRRGEIWQFEFGKPNRRRPVLVLTRDAMIGRLGSVTVAPITRTIRGVPSEVIVGPDCGLKEPSAINFHNVTTVPLAGLHRFVGTVPPPLLDRVCLSIAYSLGCRP